MKKTLLTFLAAGAVLVAAAQSDSTRTRGFRKDKLFTGGSLSLGFGTGYFLGGVNPMLGYQITNWLDAGIAVNYTFTQRRYIYGDDKARQSLYGAGAFTRIFPVHVLFAQAQYEYNFIKFKYYPAGGGDVQQQNFEAPSLLVGAGYASGRDPQGGRPYGYLSVLWDVLKDPNSPYVDGYGRPTPQIRAGLIVPLFQGKRNRDFDEGGPLRRRW